MAASTGKTDLKSPAFEAGIHSGDHDVYNRAARWAAFIVLAIIVTISTLTGALLVWWLGLFAFPILVFASSYWRPERRVAVFVFRLHHARNPRLARERKAQ